MRPKLHNTQGFSPLQAYGGHQRAELFITAAAIKKMATRASAVTMVIATLGLAGCEASQPDAFVPVGHPANPQSASGMRIGPPGALQPEVIEAKPSAAKPAG